MLCAARCEDFSKMLRLRNHDSGKRRPFLLSARDRQLSPTEKGYDETNQLDSDRSFHHGDAACRICSGHALTVAGSEHPADGHAVTADAERGADADSEHQLPIVQRFASDAQRMFVGSIAKASSGKFVLHTGGTDYQLDDQVQAGKFDGKDVKVTGQLDQSSNTIKVQSIEPSTSM